MSGSLFFNFLYIFQLIQNCNVQGQATTGIICQTSELTMSGLRTSLPSFNTIMDTLTNLQDIAATSLAEVFLSGWDSTIGFSSKYI